MQYSTTKLSNNVPWTRKCKAWLLERTYFEISPNKNLCTSSLLVCLVLRERKMQTELAWDAERRRSVSLQEKAYKEAWQKISSIALSSPIRRGRKSKKGERRWTFGCISQLEGIGLLEYHDMTDFITDGCVLYYETAAGNSISSQLGSSCQGTEGKGRPVHHVQTSHLPGHSPAARQAGRRVDPAL